MNQKQKLILTTLQSDFPLTRNPYQDMAARLDMSEQELMRRVALFKKRGIVRRVGAVVSSRHLGYKSILVGVRVSGTSVASTASFVNSFDNVTHNYLRGASFNLWCTFSAKTKKEIAAFLGALKKRPGVQEVLALPARRVFKINAEFSW